MSDGICSIKNKNNFHQGKFYNCSFEHVSYFCGIKLLMHMREAIYLLIAFVHCKRFLIESFID